MKYAGVSAVSGPLRAELCLFYSVFYLFSASLSFSADLYWDTDEAGPLVGSSSTLNLSDSYFSTAASGDTALTVSSSGDKWYFQAETIQAYTCRVDVAQTIDSITVSNGNNVTITTADPSLTCTNMISIQDGSSMTFHHSAGNRRVLADSRSTGGMPSVVLGADANTMKFSGSYCNAYWLDSLTGDADDRFGAADQSMWVIIDKAGTFPGKLFGTLRLKATMIVTADNDEFTGKFETGSLTLGDGGTSGSIGSAVLQLGTLKFNRSDNYVFTNTVDNGNQMSIYNNGTGSVAVNDGFGGNQLRLYGDRGALRGDINLAQYLWHEGPGTWVLTGSNVVGGAVVNYAIMARNGGTFQIGDGTRMSSLSLTNAAYYFQLRDTASLAMDIRGGALLSVAGDLDAGNGTSNYLKITGEGQEDPIITFGGAIVTAFDGVVYNGETNTWAEAQVARGLGGVTQMRVESNGIFIDPLPSKGTLFVFE